MRKLTIILTIAIVSIANNIYAQNSNIPLRVVNEGIVPKYYLEGFSSKEISCESIFNIWQNRPYAFFQKEEQTELETQVYLETTESGKRDLESFNKIRNQLKSTNCLLEVQLSRLVPKYDMETKKFYVIESEDPEFLTLNKVQFDHVVLNKPANISVKNVQVTERVTWNYYYLPITDLQTIMDLEKNSSNYLLKVEFKILNVTKIPETLWRYSISATIQKMQIVNTNSGVIVWQLTQQPTQKK